MSYQIELETKITINVKNCNFEHLTAKFLFALKDLFQQFITAVLLHYFEEYYKNGKLKMILGIACKSFFASCFAIFRLSLASSFCRRSLSVVGISAGFTTMFFIPVYLIFDVPKIC